MKLVSVGKAVIRRKSDGRYLILRGSEWEDRPDRSRQPDLPGGVVEQGETIEQGCVREVFEEAGITVTPADLKLAHAYSFIFEDKEAVNRLIFFVEVEGDPIVTLSWEHEAYMWLTADEILALEIRRPYPEVFRHMNSIGLLV